MPLKVLDLFAGIGGFTLAFQRCGMETVALVEKDHVCQVILKKNFNGIPIYRDVKNVTRQRLQSDGIPRIDVVTAGFPCTDVSESGRQEGIHGQQSGLFFEVIRIVSEIRPRYLVLENVTGLLTGNRGQWFSTVLGQLAGIGYDCEWNCIPAAITGAPHFRNRVWIIANPQCSRSQGQGRYSYEINSTPNAYREANQFVFHVQKHTMPYVCRRHDGISPKLDKSRLKALGNSICPSVAEIIGKAIQRDYENVEKVV